ncbi:MAG TPA: hypothetical protein DCQ58_09310 [Saprospirales bacterium]|nr:hypothetical protein [Saprospirales bacterium]
MKSRILIVLVLMFFANLFYAKVILPQIFSENMVLQRDIPLTVWGWADPGEKIEVKFNQQLLKVKADKKGNWKVVLAKELAGGPFELKVIGKKNVIQIKNVLVGEVWLCSGQSNMEWTVRQSMNAQEVIQNADNPMIRHIKVDRTISSIPVKDITETEWQVCESSTVGSFTGVGYFFAKVLYEKLKVPVGIINSSWGGSNIETWISKEGFEGSEEFKNMIAQMPVIDMDAMMQMRIAGSLNRIEALQGSRPGSLNGEQFIQPYFNDSKWPEIMQPLLWEAQEIGDLDGVVWLRKTIHLDQVDIVSGAILELSKIDDTDVTYLNGVQIGNTNQYDLKRRYLLPEGLLKVGNNVITIKITDTGGGGGIYGADEEVRLTLGEKIIPLNGKWKYQVTDIIKSANQNSLPSLCYNAMIHPLVPYGIRGALWYQGESNAGRAYQYRTAFPLMISDWRQKWALGDFPFYFVQLATFKTGGDSNEGCGWAELREAQTLTLGKVPNTGMCVTTDIGDPNDIHPVNKQDVGKRLAFMALNDVYEMPVISRGPSFKSIKKEGKKLVLSFEDIGSGLYTPDKYGYLKGFELAGADRKFYFARAYIQKNQVIVEADQVDAPVAVRFGWIGDASECNLFNKEGFPAVPFRSDDWPGVTLNEKYKMEKLQ